MQHSKENFLNFQVLCLNLLELFLDKLPVLQKFGILLLYFQNHE